MIEKLIQNLIQNPSVELITAALSLTDKSEIQKLYQGANDLRVSEVGSDVYFRGILELSNRCQKDCYYCGIRKSMRINRYTMSQAEILEMAEFAHKSRYGSMVLQSGERDDEEFISYINNLIAEIKKIDQGKIGITLSLGEQTKETYKRWFDLGAHRYLLRIETSDKNLYKRLHPETHDYDRRLQCLDDLKEIGYQTGTGVMIGLPFQTRESLARDVLFFKNQDIDMIGMGPYILHDQTPIASEVDNSESTKEDRLNLALKMIAVTRLVLKDVNIAAATALQSLHPEGREMAIRSGANVIMPNLTPVKYRGDYLLYENKPCIDEDAVQCKDCLAFRIESAGSKIGWDEWGDSKHFFKRQALL